jgi:hypothetical protein
LQIAEFQDSVGLQQLDGADDCRAHRYTGEKRTDDAARK